MFQNNYTGTFNFTNRTATTMFSYVDTDMVASDYHVVPYLQCCYASLATSNAAHDYWKCYTKL